MRQRRRRCSRRQEACASQARAVSVEEAILAQLLCREPQWKSDICLILAN
jgi:hypothetical protein